MINKDFSLFVNPKAVTQDFNSVVTQPTVIEQPAATITPYVPVQPVQVNRGLSENDVLSILEGFGPDFEEVAGGSVQSILNKTPTVVINRDSNQVLTFSNDSSLFTIKDDKGKDSDVVTLAKEDDSTLQLAKPTSKKTLERSIIDGDISGAFAGPNKMYPVTCYNDVKKILKEGKTNTTESYKRVMSRALSIATRYGWIDTDVQLTEIPSTTSDILYLSDTVIDKEVDINKVNLTVLNSDDSDFYAFEDNENGKMMLKIPAARIGKWIHSEYGVVEFTQEKFDQAIDNFNAGVLGYEPTLNVGHFVEVQSFGSAPTEGIAVEVYQEEDVLYANYECLNPIVYGDVLNQRYRRSSSELIMDYVDRTNDRSVGMTLVGMALTNRPFITDMPTVNVFSENNASYSLDNKPVTFAQFNLYKNDNTNKDSINKNSEELNKDSAMNLDLNDISVNNQIKSDLNMPTELETKVTPEIATPTTVTSESSKINSLSSEVQEIKVAFEKAMELQKQQFSLEKDALNARNTALENRLAVMEAERESKSLQEKIKVIKDLNLSEANKDEYIQMFTQKTFGNKENEDTVLTTLIKTFGKDNESAVLNKYTQQLGYSSVEHFVDPNSDTNKDKHVNFYATLIERNKTQK